METEKRVELDGVSYVMTPANAMSAWQAVKNALKLASGIDLTGGDSKKVGASLLSTILSNLGDPAVKAMEDIVLKHTAVTDDGRAVRLSDNPDRHFNQHRSHLVPLLIEGVKYQFGDFFTGGAALLNATPLLNQNENNR